MTGVQTCALPISGGPNVVPVTDPTGTFWLYKTISQLATWLGFGTAANYNVGTGANNVVQLDSSGNISDLIGLTTYSNKNVLINGEFKVDQRNVGAAQTITAGAALAYTVDRWWGACTGANVTGQRVAGTTPNKYNYQFTGAASVTGIQFGQRIEAINSQHAAGQTVSLGIDLANSLLTSVGYSLYYANTADTFGTLASPAKTLISSGTFTVNSTLTRYSVNVSIPSAAINGLELVLNVGAQISGTWTIGRVQLELGSKATNFEFLPYDRVLNDCLFYYKTGLISGVRYFFSSAGSTVEQRCFFNAMRVTPTVVSGAVISQTNVSSTNSQADTNASFVKALTSKNGGDTYHNINISLDAEMKS